MTTDRPFAIRKGTFLGGILGGAILGALLFQHGWLPGAIIGALLGGSFLGSVGEAYVGGDRGDVIGAGVTLGLLAGIAAALAYRPLTWWSALIPIGSVLAAVTAGWLGFGFGRLISHK